MTCDLETMQREWLGRIEAAGDLAALEGERVAALGKQGSVTQLLKTLGGMTPEQRQSEGPRIHGLREAVTEAMPAARLLEAADLDRRLATEDARHDAARRAGAGAASIR
jgi:phenylalanyl-tRNA synthetase alpha chain